MNNRKSQKKLIIKNELLVIFNSFQFRFSFSLPKYNFFSWHYNHHLGSTKEWSSYLMAPSSFSSMLVSPPIHHHHPPIAKVIFFFPLLEKTYHCPKVFLPNNSIK